MNSAAAPGISSQGIKCQRGPHLNRQSKNCSPIFSKCHEDCRHLDDGIEGKVGIWLLYFRRVLRRRLWAFHMLILNCVFMTRSDILPRLAHLILRESLSTSFIPHPQTRFGRLILKEGRIQCGAIRQSHLPAQSPFPTTQLLPPIYLPSVSLKASHPIVWPFFAHLRLSFFVHNQLGDYSNQVINYGAPRSFCATRFRVPQSGRRQPGWAMLLLRPSMTCCNSGCNCFRLILTDEALTESRDTAQHCACNKYKHPLTADSLTQLYLACPAIQIFIWLDSPSREGINSLQVLHYNSPRGIAKFFFSFLFFSSFLDQFHSSPLFGWVRLHREQVIGLLGENKKPLLGSLIGHVGSISCRDTKECNV